MMWRGPMLGKALEQMLNQTQWRDLEYLIIDLPPGTGDVAATVHVRALQDTWVQAVDANKQTLLARMVPAGETVALSPAMPLRVRIGNVAGTELLLRGKPVDLSPGKRDNIVSLTLQ